MPSSRTRSVGSTISYTVWGSAKQIRDAKELLCGIVREQALSEDRLWHAVIEDAADRILASFQGKIGS